MGKLRWSNEDNQNKFVWGASTIWWVGGTILISASIITGILINQRWPKSSITWVIKSVPAIAETAKPLTEEWLLPEEQEMKRVQALFEEVTPEETLASRLKDNEAILAEFQKKIEKNPQYTPTRAEKIALAQLWIAVNDGTPIPYEGDGKEENK